MPERSSSIQPAHSVFWVVSPTPIEICSRATVLVEELTRLALAARGRDEAGIPTVRPVREAAAQIHEDAQCMSHGNQRERRRAASKMTRAWLEHRGPRERDRRAVQRDGSRKGAKVMSVGSSLGVGVPFRKRLRPPKRKRLRAPKRKLSVHRLGMSACPLQERSACPALGKEGTLSVARPTRCARDKRLPAPRATIPSWTTGGRSRST